MFSHSWRILSELRGVFRTQSSMWGKVFLKKLLTVSFCKKAPSQMCDWVLNTPGFVLYSICVIRILAQPLKFSSEGVFFLVNIIAEERQLYKTKLLHLYLLRIYKKFQYLPLIQRQNPKWGWKSICFGRASPDGYFRHRSFNVPKQNCSHYDYIR